MSPFTPHCKLQMFITYVHGTSVRRHMYDRIAIIFKSLDIAKYPQ